jgi:SAM-dependent methyltransferase
VARRRLVLASLALGALGALIAGGWLLATGGFGALRGLGRARPAFLVLLAAVTLAHLLLRFLRWQFLLRRAEVRLPERRSLSIYLASLPGMATPAYLGEALRAVFARRAFGTPVRVTLAVLVAERLLDVMALMLVGALTARGSLGSGPFLAGAAAAALAGLPLRSLARTAGVPAEALAGLSRPASLGWGLVFSLAAWLTASLSVPLAARALAEPVGALEGIGVFAGATLAGGLTLMPAGVGATGSAALLALQRAGLPLARAVPVVTLFRLATTGLALGLGSVFLLIELSRSRARTPHPAAPAHFDAIADGYCAQYAPHVWDLLLRRRIDLIAARLGPPAGAGIGLDLGCGLGHQVAELRGRGYRVVGVDASRGLLRAARRGGASVLSGDALRLPFRDASLDFVYAVGVLHHLPGTGAQAAAAREIARVLRPGGCFVVQETNTRNPLFRFYMTYVFPLLRTIDEGTEQWIPPAEWRSAQGLVLEELRFFTFLPDWVPRALLPPLLTLERRLEASRFSHFAVHYMAVLRKGA